MKSYRKKRYFLHLFLSEFDEKLAPINNQSILPTEDTAVNNVIEVIITWLDEKGDVLLEETFTIKY